MSNWMTIAFCLRMSFLSWLQPQAQCSAIWRSLQERLSQVEIFQIFRYLYLTIPTWSEYLHHKKFHQETYISPTNIHFVLLWTCRFRFAPNLQFQWKDQWSLVSCLANRTRNSKRRIIAIVICAPEQEDTYTRTARWPALSIPPKHSPPRAREEEPFDRFSRILRQNYLQSSTGDLGKKFSSQVCAASGWRKSQRPQVLWSDELFIKKKVLGVCELRVCGVMRSIQCVWDAIPDPGKKVNICAKWPFPQRCPGWWLLPEWLQALRPGS